MLWRGLTLRCAFCGGREVFQSWFELKQRCPSCAHRFDQEEGFFLGAYALNLALTEGILLASIVPYIFLSATDPHAGRSVWPFVFIAVVGAVAGPLVFFPFSRTLWVALDLTLQGGRNLKPDPEAEAQEEEAAG